MDRQGVWSIIQGSGKSGELPLEDYTGLFTLEATVSNSAGESQASLDFSRISHVNFNGEFDDNPYSGARELIGDWSILKTYSDRLINSSTLSSDTLDDILAIEEVDGNSIFDNNAVGIVDKRYLVLDGNDTIIMYELTGFDELMSFGFTDGTKYARAGLSLTTYNDLDQFTTGLTGINDIIDVAGDTAPSSAVLDGAGVLTVPYSEGTIDISVDERIRYQVNGDDIDLSIVHNPTDIELDNMQTLNDYNNPQGTGFVAVYDNDSPFMVWTRLIQAYEILENPQTGVTIPLNDPAHVE